MHAYSSPIQDHTAVHQKVVNFESSLVKWKSIFKNRTITNITTQIYQKLSEVHYGTDPVIWGQILVHICHCHLCCPKTSREFTFSPNTVIIIFFNLCNNSLELDLHLQKPNITSEANFSFLKANTNRFSLASNRKVLNRLQSIFYENFQIFIESSKPSQYSQVT